MGVPMIINVRMPFDIKSVNALRPILMNPWGQKTSHCTPKANYP